MDGLNSYVATLTETVESVSNDQGILEERVLNSESRVSELEHTVDGLSVTMQEQYIGGINYVQNSSGLTPAGRPEACNMVPMAPSSNNGRLSARR